MLSKGVSGVFSRTTVGRRHCFGTVPCTLEATPEGCHRDPFEVTVPQRKKATLGDVESLELTSTHCFFMMMILIKLSRWLSSKESNEETQIQSLDWEDPLEKERAAHSSILAWEIPWTEEPGWIQPMGSQRIGYN